MLLVSTGLLATVLMIGLLVWAARATNDQAAADSEKLVRTGLASLVERMKVTTIDYAWWEEAYFNVIRREQDHIYDNIGSSVMGSTFDLVAILLPDLSMPYAWNSDVGEEISLDAIPGAHARNLRDALTGLPIAPVTARHAFTWIDGRLTLTAAARLTPYDTDGLTEAELPTLVTGLWLTDEILAGIGDTILLDGLRLIPAGQVPAPGLGAITIAGLDGDAIARLAWELPRPGDRLLVTLLPIALLFGAVLLVSFSVVGRSVRQQAWRIIDERRRAWDAARTDKLTGLLNRAGVADALRGEDIAAAIGRGAAAMIYLDLNGFKGLNDVAGHEGGDKALQVTARRLRLAARKGDIVARMGGDEFLILILDREPEAAARRIMADIAAMMAEPIEVAGEFFLAQASAGIALARDAADPQDLILKADAAMYAAKETRSIEGVFFTADLMAERDAQRRIEVRLRHAVERAEAGESRFRLVYQPILHSGNGKLQKAEALLRWHDDELGEVSPDVFIPVAESYGLVPRLGLLAFRQTCRDMAKAPDFRVSVNVSTVLLRDARFPEQILEITRTHGIDPGLLTLELTEGALIEVPHLAKARMDELRRMGFRLSLDDFGTGFSSISYLKRFRFDELKIDKSFIVRLGEDLRADMLFRSMIQLAKAFELDVVAEGIETEQQSRFVRHAECDYEQGFLHARPSSFEELCRLRALDLDSPDRCVGQAAM